MDYKDFATLPPSDSGLPNNWLPSYDLSTLLSSRSLSNINVFALAFTLTLSLTFTFLDLVILRFFIYLSKFKKALSPHIERWIQDDIFQLQRRAYEATGQGVWAKLEKEIPITRQATMLSDLIDESTPPGVFKGRVNTSSDSSTSNYDLTEKDHSDVAVC